MSRPLSDAQRRQLTELVVQMTPRISAYVRRTFGPRVDCEEVVAETFCRAAQNFRAMQARPRADFFLLTIARNLCLDALRRKRASNVEFGDRAAVNPDSGDALSRSEEGGLVSRALEHLPEAQREVLVLRFSAGLTFEEIAKLLDIPLGTALSRSHAAMERVRAELGVRT
ncbi:MAG: sigma-70 family RNA polymerase sigma factor [Phycisphaerae bacterium]